MEVGAIKKIGNDRDWTDDDDQGEGGADSSQMDFAVTRRATLKDTTTMTPLCVTHAVSPS